MTTVVRDTPPYRPGPWRLVPPVPYRPLHAAVARRLLTRVAAQLPVRVVLPDGEVVGTAPDGPATLHIHDHAFFHRVGADALVGFGESFMAGEWDAEDPAAALTPFAARMGTLVPAWLQRLRRWYVRYQPDGARNPPERARKHIEHHYDLSNELFARFLDSSMTYSSGFFRPGDTLEAAQARKIDRLLDRLQVGAGTRLLEIGTGWGALAVRAAERGAHVTTVTLSTEQCEAARTRAAQAGVAERVDVRLSDYRHLDGTWDAVVSVEMIEAVGAPHWREFVEALDRFVVPGGRVGVQAIVLPHDRMLATLNQLTWIHKYIFPGGALPSVEELTRLTQAHTRLRLHDTLAFGQSYATTLRAWRDRFTHAADDVEALGFDATFRRMWIFYLAYCEAGFASDYLNVVQLVWERQDA